MALQQQLRLMLQKEAGTRNLFPVSLHRLSISSSEQIDRDSLKEASSGKVSSRDAEGTA
ncbi:hypothetical protein [Prolixibacter denitrificans]|uniref:hypothetical protein n=1 Tax=Prolixibacter denitrificans TaxID=1541063 RepID=UPI001298F565|nr:hypothetical protein [Prolixibacter denitrificans]